MNNAKDMHRLALAKALKIGPRVIIANGEKMAAYGLYRAELDELYEDNHFVTTRSTWLTHIESWPKYGAVVPQDLKKNTGEWFVIFGYIDKTHFKQLQMFAENNDSGYYPRLPEGASA